jgi:CubicO group peptidase (beta-lactamase class C family)
MGRGQGVTQLLAFVVISAVVFDLIGCGGSNSSSQQAPSQQQPSLGTAVDSAVKSFMQISYAPGVTVALAQNGVMIYAKGYGVTNLATRQATQPDTIFQIDSITKQFTATLIMKLQEQGQLHVDDSMANYLPQYRFPPEITIRMLLTHTSGLINYTALPQFADWSATGVSETTVLTAVSQQPLEFQPGTQYVYSNSNYFALGSIIENVTGQTYAANLDQYIFQPLALQSTSYELPAPAMSATGYSNAALSPMPLPPWSRSAGFAAGAISTNVYDLVAWVNALLNGKVVSPASFKEMTTTNGFITNNSTYGFGLSLTTYDGHPVVGHSGGGGGFSTEEVAFLDSGFTLIVLTNEDNDNPNALALSISKAVCGSTRLPRAC